MSAANSVVRLAARQTPSRTVQDAAQTPPRLLWLQRTLEAQTARLRALVASQDVRTARRE